MRIAIATMLVLLSFAAARGEDVPVPRPRPPEAPALADPEKPVEPSACQLRIAEKIAAIEALPDITGPGQCGGTDLVKLNAVILPDKTRIPLTPAATLRCSMAEAVANWVRDDVSASVKSLGGVLRALDNFDSYDCRGRNRNPLARMSEHGRANALDVRGVKLGSGTMLSLTDAFADRNFREDMRRSVCARFNTVLGPGSDGYHEDHIHLDLAERSRGYKMCQWALRVDVPLPKARPVEENDKPDSATGDKKDEAKE